VARRGDREQVQRSGCDPIAHAIGCVAWRQRCELVATVVAIEAHERPSLVLDVIVDDGTGTLRCTFFGRQAIPGLDVGRRVAVAGRLVRYRNRRCLLNPAYELLDGDSSTATSS
jgi:RecG-like helicase